MSHRNSVTHMHPIGRFILILLMCAAMLGLVARVTLADDKWFAPLLAWGAAFALANVDAYFRGREKLKP